MIASNVIPDTWKEWLLHNRDRGCAREGLIEKAMAQGYDRVAIECVLDGSDPSSTSGSVVSPFPATSCQQWFEASMTRPEHQPRAWRLERRWLRSMKVLTC